MRGSRQRSDAKMLHVLDDGRNLAPGISRTDPIPQRNTINNKVEGDREEKYAIWMKWINGLQNQSYVTENSTETNPPRVEKELMPINLQESQTPDRSSGRIAHFNPLIDDESYPVTDVLDHELVLDSRHVPASGSLEQFLFSLFGGDHPPFDQQPRSQGFIERSKRSLRSSNTVQEYVGDSKNQMKRTTPRRKRQRTPETDPSEPEITDEEVTNYTCMELYQGTMANVEAVIRYLVDNCPIVDICEYDVNCAMEDRVPMCEDTGKHTCLFCVHCKT